MRALKNDILLDSRTDPAWVVVIQASYTLQLCVNPDLEGPPQGTTVMRRNPKSGCRYVLKCVQEFTVPYS